VREDTKIIIGVVIQKKRTDTVDTEIKITTEKMEGNGGDCHKVNHPGKNVNAQQSIATIITITQSDNSGKNYCQQLTEKLSLKSDTIN
jgi:hypothetical protein